MEADNSSAASLSNRHPGNERPSPGTEPLAVIGIAGLGRLVINGRPQDADPRHVAVLQALAAEPGSELSNEQIGAFIKARKGVFYPGRIVSRLTRDFAGSLSGQTTVPVITVTGEGGVRGKGSSFKINPHVVVEELVDMGSRDEAVRERYAAVRRLTSDKIDYIPDRTVEPIPVKIVSDVELELRGGRVRLGQDERFMINAGLESQGCIDWHSVRTMGYLAARSHFHMHMATFRQSLRDAAGQDIVYILNNINHIQTGVEFVDLRWSR